MFSNSPKPAYVKAKDGKMHVKLNNQTQEFDNVEGRLASISYHESEYQGETIKQWRLYLENGNDRAILSIGFSGSFTKGLINSLLSADLSQPIMFSCYMKNDYNQPSIKQAGQIVKWKYQLDEIPKPKKVTVGTKEVTDDSEVAAWITQQVEFINSLLKKSIPATKPVETTDEPSELDDLPF